MFVLEIYGLFLVIMYVFDQMNCLLFYFDYKVIDLSMEMLLENYVWNGDENVEIGVVESD